MQSAVPVGQGGMVAVIGFASQDIPGLCKWAEQKSAMKPLEPANYNSPEQTVLSGNLKLINWLQENYKPEEVAGAPKRAKFIPLKVSAPFHCSLMKPAEETMRAVLTATVFSAPSFPVVQNKPGKALDKPKEIAENLIGQVTASVRWVDCVLELKKLAPSAYLELGTGQVLAGLNKKIDASLRTINFANLEDFKKFEQAYRGGGEL